MHVPFFQGFYLCLKDPKSSCRPLCSQRLSPVTALNGTRVQDLTAVSACWAEATAAMCSQKIGPGQRGFLSAFFNVASAKIRLHFHRTTQTKNKTKKRSSSVSFSPWSGPIQVTGYAPKSVMNSCLVLPCLEFKAVSQPCPVLAREQGRQEYSLEVRPREKRESGQLFLEALGVGFL